MSDLVGLGIIGVGRWADAHAAAAARSSEVELVNCHARSEQSRSEFSRRHGVASVAASVDELLADPAVQAVVVSTPNDLHVEHARASIAAGKPVLVDKPVAVDLAEGLGLRRAASASGVPVGVAHHARRLAGIREAARWMGSPSAGRVRLATADFSNNRSAHMKPDAWHRLARGSEGGALIQVGIHQVDNMLYLLGPVASVSATFRHETLGPTMPDLAAVTLVHASGAVSVVTTSWTTPGHFTVEIQGVEGSYRYELDHGHWTSGDVDDHGRASHRIGLGRWEPAQTPKGDPLVEQIEELAASRMEVDIVAGLRAAAVVEAAVESWRSNGARIEIADLARRSGATDTEVGVLVGK